MDEKKARKILGDRIFSNNTLYSIVQFVAWPSAHGKKHAVLDAEFTADELEAIAWWMSNK